MIMFFYSISMLIDKAKVVGKVDKFPFFSRLKSQTVCTLLSTRKAAKRSLDSCCPIWKV